jgi:hypothetical protein
MSPHHNSFVVKSGNKKQTADGADDPESQAYAELPEATNDLPPAIRFIRAIRGLHSQRNW